MIGVQCTGLSDCVYQIISQWKFRITKLQQLYNEVLSITTTTTTTTTKTDKHLLLTDFHRAMIELWDFFLNFLISGINNWREKSRTLKCKTILHLKTLSYLLLSPIILTNSCAKFKLKLNPSLVTLLDASITNTRSSPLAVSKLMALPRVTIL